MAVSASTIAVVGVGGVEGVIIEDMAAAAANELGGGRDEGVGVVAIVALLELSEFE